MSKPGMIIKRLLLSILVLSLFVSCGDFDKNCMVLIKGLDYAASGTWYYRVTALSYLYSVADIEEIQASSGGWKQAEIDDNEIDLGDFDVGVWFVEILWEDGEGNTYYGWELVLIDKDDVVIVLGLSDFIVTDGDAGDDTGESGTTGGDTSNDDDGDDTTDDDDSSSSSASNKMIWITVINYYKNMTISRVGTQDKWTLTLTNYDSDSTKTWKINNSVVTDDGYTGSLSGVTATLGSDSLTLTLELSEDFSDNGLNYLFLYCSESGTSTTSHYLELGVVD